MQSDTICQLNQFNINSEAAMLSSLFVVLRGAKHCPWLGGWCWWLTAKYVKYSKPELAVPGTAVQLCSTCYGELKVYIN